MLDITRNVQKLCLHIDCWVVFFHDFVGFCAQSGWRRIKNRFGRGDAATWRREYMPPKTLSWGIDKNWPRTEPLVRRGEGLIFWIYFYSLIPWAAVPPNGWMVNRTANSQNDRSIYFPTITLIATRWFSLTLSPSLQPSKNQIWFYKAKRSIVFTLFACVIEFSLVHFLLVVLDLRKILHT